MPPSPSIRPADSPLRGLAALQRLRTRIEETVDEIERLQQENAALAERVGHLEEAVSGESPVFPIDGDPASLRDKVKGFIEAIDRALVTGEPPEGFLSSAPDSDADPDPRDG